MANTAKLCNGVYIIDGVTYMSVWAYNNAQAKTIDAVQMWYYALNTQAPFINVIPEANTVHRTVKAYPLAVLDKHAERY